MSINAIPDTVSTVRVIGKNSAVRCGQRTCPDHRRAVPLHRAGPHPLSRYWRRPSPGRLSGRGDSRCTFRIGGQERTCGRRKFHVALDVTVRGRDPEPPRCPKLVTDTDDDVRVAAERPGHGLEGFRSSHQDTRGPGHGRAPRLHRRYTAQADVELIDSLTKEPPDLGSHRGCSTPLQGARWAKPLAGRCPIRMVSTGCDRWTQSEHAKLSRRGDNDRVGSTQSWQRLGRWGGREMFRHKRLRRAGFESEGGGNFESTGFR